jgi:site-specific DNA recombinase
VSIEKVEKAVEDFWRSVHFPKVDLDALRAELLAKVEAELGSTSKYVPAQKRRIAKLENERKKLLQAFYADAIPQELLREEQERISREIAAAEQVIEDHDVQAERATQFLEDLLTLCDDPYALYLCADAPIRQLLNRAVVTRFWIMGEGLHTAELTPEFAAIREQVREFAQPGPAQPVHRHRHTSTPHRG